MKKYFPYICLTLLFFTFLAPPLPANAGYNNGLSTGQVIYVPAYSHIYIGDRDVPFLLAVTLSIRNVDPNHPIKIVLADYYETEGKRLKKHIDKQVTMKPLESIRLFIPEKDKSGGSGANFIVEWKSDKPVNQPIVESIMIGSRGTQGISFTSRGQAIVNSK